jgi:hypothetical protein
MFSIGTEIVRSSPGFKTSLTFIVSMANPWSAFKLLITFKTSGFELRSFALMVMVLLVLSTRPGPLGFHNFAPCSSAVVNRASSAWDDLF